MPPGFDAQHSLRAVNPIALAMLRYPENITNYSTGLEYNVVPQSSETVTIHKNPIFEHSMRPTEL